MLNVILLNAYTNSDFTEIRQWMLNIFWVTNQVEFYQATKLTIRTIKASIVNAQLLIINTGIAI